MIDINRRRFLKGLGYGLAGLHGSCWVHGSKLANDNRPSVLLFITDDESWLERSAYGWSTLPTPHFDRVARQGVLFTNGFTSAPSCAPSRAGILTGRNFWELKQGAFIQAWLPKEFPVLPRLLEEHGYLVGRTGKGWGPGVYPEQGHGPEVAGKVFNERKVADPVRGISPIDYAGNLQAFLKERSPGQPFFFWAGPTEPHGPWDRDNHLRLEKEYGVGLDDIKVPPFVEDTSAYRKTRANFLYEICYADKQLGRMLDYLELASELDNTLVIVTSDNGTAIAKGKATPYDWATHEPLAVMWPARVPKGRTVTDFVNFVDFAPTILEATGIRAPASMSGRSFLDVLLSEKSGRIDLTRNFTVTGLEWHGEFDPERRTARTIRTDQYACIMRYDNDEDGTDGRPVEPSAVELYDIKNDPWQETDLSARAEYRDIRKKLSRQLINFGRQTDDPRMTGEMKVFRETRLFVQERKRGGYKK
jgi:N-sulfoglucosamine sulfohydrolase